MRREAAEAETDGFAYFVVGGTAVAFKMAEDGLIQFIEASRRRAFHAKLLQVCG